MRMHSVIFNSLVAMCAGIALTGFISSPASSDMPPLPTDPGWGPIQTYSSFGFEYYTCKTTACAIAGTADPQGNITINGQTINIGKASATVSTREVSNNIKMYLCTQANPEVTTSCQTHGVGCAQATLYLGPNCSYALNVPGFRPQIGWQTSCDHPVPVAPNPTPTTPQ